MDKKEIRQKAMEKAIKVVVTSEQVEAALRMGFTRDEDILVLTSLHRPESQRTIEGILNKYSQNVKNKSIWVNKLIRSSNIAKDIAKRDINYECYVIDEANISDMRMWGDLKTTQEQKELTDTLLGCLDRETINEVIKDLSNPKLNPKGVASIYEKYNKSWKDVLRSNGVTLRTFSELAIKFLHKENQCGWNYANIRKRKGV